ncbi:CHAT domain-containing protein [Variovorax gossypii]|uniref:CHAT domain-containing protein n=1 Tax=Variovorax gossypii TaxID=1679495 RepID=A0A3S0I9V5_9BURK|nr:SAV_2336 N-terminal domain-related protein [Variovorax gossypii]RTQ30652.1 CHAT domain-containing protein [Variovorax gossypii]
MEIGELIRRLRAAGLEVDWPDLRDMLWLAPKLTPLGRHTLEEAISPVEPSTPSSPAQTTPDARPDEQSSVPRPHGISDSDAERAAAYAAGGTGGGASARRIQLRGAPALPQALAIARALRPLSRRRAGKRLELDERATAEFIAEAGYRGAVWRPARERWFDIVVAIDDVPSLAAWGPTVSRFERLLRRQGGFRDVRTLLLRPQGERVGTFGPDGREVSISALQDRDGRRIVIVVSDCTALAWRDGRMGAWMQAAGGHAPVAVAQLLPQSLWPNTAIGFAELQTRSPRLGATVPEMRVKLPSWAHGEPGMVVPVVALEPAAVNTWARMMSAAGEAWSPAALLPLPDVDPDNAAADDQPTAVERLSRFRASATPDAQRLAAYFSVVRPLSPPVMRVIHWAIAPASGAVALAQVFLAGILFPVPKPEPEPGSGPSSNADDKEYDFYPGLRDPLAQTLTRAEFVQINLALHDYLQQKSGTDFDFFALLEDPAGSARLPAAALPFVQSSRAFARRFGADAPSTAEKKFLDIREPVAELRITPEGDRLAFVYRSPRGQLTLRHDLPQGVTGLLSRALHQGTYRTLQELAEAVVPAGLSESTAIVQGPGLVELLVDEAIDLLPWEILLGPPRVAVESLAIERGLTRRALGPRRRVPTEFGEPAQVLIVADPPTNQKNMPSLPGARHEADSIATLLEQALSTRSVHKLVAGSAIDVISNLLLTAPRVLHIAAHSRLRTGTGFDNEFGNSGMGDRVEILLDQDSRLTLRDFGSMERVPELIFLGTHYTAAMAPELIRLGAQAVVGCFGQLNDEPARDFAIAFYEALARGSPLIEAMREARQQCWRKHPSDPAWGLFQCYGDPSWRLLKRPPATIIAPDGIPPIEAPPPRAWVLVAGTGDKSKLSAKLARTCKDLGVGLARGGYGLVTGAWPGVDQAVIRSFVDELELDVPNAPLDARLMHVMTRSRKPPSQAGQLKRVTKGEEEYTESIRHAQFVVLVGGSGGTLEIGERARAAGRPVLPLADTGGAARTFHRLLTTDQEAPGSEKDTPMNLKVLAAPAPVVVGHVLDMLELLTRQLTDSQPEA